MENGYNIIRKNKLKKMTWSGGTIEELFIYPENAKYENRDFIFVISTATVDIEESNFTILKNYNRIIMTLDNTLVLTHNDKEKITLSKYEPHVFYGGDKTQSYGKVNDYNFIMNREICYGDVCGMSIASGSVIYPRKSNDLCEKKLEVIYCAEGKFTFKIEDAKHIINQGETLIIDHETIGKSYTFSNDEAQMCDMIIVTAKVKTTKGHD